MSFIFAILCLNFINRADCLGRIFEGCEGKSEIYIQWYPPISGWYTRNLSTKNEYARTPPNITDLNRYEFLLDRGEWNLIQWANNWSKSIEFRKEDKELSSYIPTALNIDIHPSPSRRQRRGKREGLTHSPSKKNKYKNTDKEMPTKTEYSKPLTNCSHEENQKDYVPELNVYCPRRCRCIKAVVNTTVSSKEFTRFDAADNETRKACWGKIENAAELPEENKEVYRSKEYNQSSTDDVDRNETDSKIKALSWKPELYVSENCEVLHYDKQYDIWIVDFGWEATSCKTFRASGAGLDNYVSNNSAVCIEYLPLAKHQQWSNAQPYNAGSEPTEDPLLFDDIIEHCGLNFTMKPNDYFSVTCTKL